MREAGFSIVELLVALAIGSFVAIGLGVLLVFAGELRDRTASTEAVSIALNEIASLARLIEELPKSVMAGATGHRFDLTPAAPTAAPPAASIELDGTRLVARTGSTEVGVVDLSAFDQASFGYLVEEQGGTRWQPAAQSSVGPVLAARIVVTSRHRAWPFVLWMQPR